MTASTSTSTSTGAGGGGGLSTLDWVVALAALVALGVLAGWLLTGQTPVQWVRVPTPAPGPSPEPPTDPTS